MTPFDFRQAAEMLMLAQPVAEKFNPLARGINPAAGLEGARVTGGGGAAAPRFPEWLNQRGITNYYVSNRAAKSEEAKGNKRIKNADYDKLMNEYFALFPQMDWRLR